MKWFIDILSIAGGLIAVLGFFFGIYHLNDLLKYGKKYLKDLDFLVRKYLGRLYSHGENRKERINELFRRITTANAAIALFSWSLFLLYAAFVSLFFVALTLLMFKPAIGPAMHVFGVNENAASAVVLLIIAFAVGIIAFIAVILGWTDKSFYLFDIAFEAMTGCLAAAGVTYFLSIFVVIISFVPWLPMKVKDTLLLFDWGMGPSEPLALLTIGAGIYGGVTGVRNKRKQMTIKS